MKRIFFFSLLAFILAAQASWAQIPDNISYQGVLTNTEGVPVVDDNYELIFSIYNVDGGGTALWTENHPSVAVVNGIFNVILGSITPLGIPFDAPYWLGITVGAGSELTPRIQFTSVAYSLNARSVADGAVTGDKIAEGQVVRNINGLADEVTLAEGPNVSITPSGNSLIISAAFDGWRLTGNAGADPATKFLGTIDPLSLNMRVNNLRAFCLEPGVTSPNIIGGFGGNFVTEGVSGAAISGGGQGGYVNSVTDDYGTVAGGCNNQAGDNAGTTSDVHHATVGGGWANTASGRCAAVGGGFGNTASGSEATVAGGYNNTASGLAATVPGGSFSTAAGDYSFAAGRRAKANHHGSFVWGDSVYADVTDTGDNQFVVRANGGAWFFTGAGGLRLDANSISPNIIGGFDSNLVFPEVVGATISGGGTGDSENRVTDNYSTVGGGKANQAGNAIGTNIDAAHATVSGGRDNVASGMYATIGGGWDNIANAFCATIAGGGRSYPDSPGTSNRVTDAYGTVSGGGDNQAGNANIDPEDACCATVSGGLSNKASHYHTTVSGGYNNTASGYVATVPGGFDNTAEGDFSFAAGRQAEAKHGGTFVWADWNNFDFNSAAANEFAVRCTGGSRFVTQIDGSGNPTKWAYLDPVTAQWGVQTSSDRNLKTDFAPVDGLDILQRLASIPVETWSYNGDDLSIRHIGPMAQDFHSTFGFGNDDKSINSLDADGVALAAIQGLYELVQKKDEQIAVQQQQIANLAERLTALEALASSREGVEK